MKEISIPMPPLPPDGYYWAYDPDEDGRLLCSEKNDQQDEGEEWTSR